MSQRANPAVLIRLRAALAFHTPFSEESIVLNRRFTVSVVDPFASSVRVVALPPVRAQGMARSMRVH